MCKLFFFWKKQKHKYANHMQIMLMNINEVDVKKGNISFQKEQNSRRLVN